MSKEQGRPEPNAETDRAVPGKKEKTVSIIFRENRKYDLHVGGKITVFKGRERKSVPVSLTKHKDFIQVQRLFVVKGV
jgi:hypothetical protein